MSEIYRGDWVEHGSATNIDKMIAVGATATENVTDSRTAVEHQESVILPYAGTEEPVSDNAHRVNSEATDVQRFRGEMPA